ncbi:type I DNA topoisomerase [Candidatus Dojkabacteria bacterium]|nr:type I DNA topoisomerase [Candidatus Dojkabacteria bacterium]
MKLVVVESPAKVKTITKYLGKGYKVVASMGHLVDLPKKELGVDIEKNFEPKYVVSNRKALKQLTDNFKGIDTLVIASDPDREGEAIGWHVAQRLGVIDKRGRVKSKKLERIVFTSITKEAIEEAIKNTRNIDLNLVDAQQARRILDRLVGYKLSPLLWKKIRYGLSAGRVQSVAVRLIVDREEERDKFKPEEYWKIFADLSVKSIQRKIEKIILKSESLENSKLEFKGIKFELAKILDKRVKIQKESEIKKVLEDVGRKKWIVSNINKKETRRYPKPPFITSTLQGTASNMFGYSAKRTMSIAQKLYESGLITYMRTDSFNIVKSELAKVRAFIKSEYGDKFLNLKEAVYKSKSSTAQEAHEAIRPTNIKMSGNAIKLGGEARKLYDLIRNRTLACQMSPARLESTTLDVQIKQYLFQSHGQIILFPGFLKVYHENIGENILPDIKLNQELYLHKIVGQQNFTSPPARYTDATLIKTLEQYGIGRPSTYAPIISTILQRKYVVKEGRYFVPTDTGKVVTKLLTKYFEKIVDTGFTAEMEEDLDSIAEGREKGVEVIKEFFNPFIKDVENGEKKIEREEFTVLGKSEHKCPECGKRMVKKIGKYGVFLSCPDFPKCKGMRSIEGETQEEKSKEIKKEVRSEEFQSKYLPAPEASDGTEMILKIGRFGKFWAHPDYPKIKEARPLLLKKKCPQCGEYLVERRGKWGKPFTGCSGYPKCRYIEGRKNGKGRRQKVKGRKAV